MHLQCGNVNQKTWPDELIVHLVIAQHVANVLAKKTFNAFSEFLHTINVLLLHAPCAVWRVGSSRFERLDFLFHSKIPRDICGQIFMTGKAFIGSIVTGLSNGNSLSRVMHISFGMPLTSAEHDPHFPALQFHRHARSGACVRWISCTASSTTMPSATSVV